MVDGENAGRDMKSMQRLASTVAGAFLIIGCGGSTASPATPSPIEDLRGGTETQPGFTNSNPSVTYMSLTLDSKLRDYRIFQPPALDLTRAVPLIVILHGSPIDAAGFEDIIHFDAQATRSGFIAVSPNGCRGYWEYNNGSKVVDQDFIREVIHRVESDFKVDKTRVFVMATSGGSPTAYRLGCDLSNEIAAVASVTGEMRMADDCKPARPVSILTMNGTEDARILYAVTEPIVERWKVIDGCVGDPTVTQSGITTTSVWNRCNGDVVVRLDKVVGGKNTWYGAGFANPVPGEPNANEVIANWFSSLRPRA